MNDFKMALRELKAPSDEWYAKAWAHLDRLTMPPRAMGKLMELAARLSSMRRELAPTMERFCVVPFCADHGLFRPQVTNSPQIVTELVARHMAEGTATVNCMARLHGGTVLPVDVGIKGDLSDLGSRMVHRKIAPGTADFASGLAMTLLQAQECLDVGAAVARHLAAENDFLAVGEMGVGNTSAAAALAAVFTGKSAAVLTGLGSGIDEGKLAHKVALIEKAIALNRPDPSDPMDVVSKVGGFEIAAMAGFIVGAAAARRPVVLDGFVSGAAALLAVRLAPDCRGYLVAAHRASERGHGTVLDALGLEPLYSLDLHLGEGAGCPLAAPFLRSAVALMGLPTFEQTGVPEGISEDGTRGAK